METAAIPDRPAFRAQEVCEIAEVQPYVLRSWEAEFPDLGVAKAAGGPRVYRRSDVERVLRLKHLILVDGLTLAGARKQLASEGPQPIDETVVELETAGPMSAETKQGLREIREGLQYILTVLSDEGSRSEEFVLQPKVAKTRKTRAKK